MLQMLQIVFRSLRRRLRLALVLFTAVSGILVDPTSLAAQDPAAWTILIYMNADNNLEPDAIIDINEMEQVGSGDDINIVVQVDRNERYDFSNGNWTGAKRFLIKRDDDALKINSPSIPWPDCIEAPTPACVAEDEIELDMADVRTLERFLHWGATTYPAQRYAVVLWSHGNGWRSEAATPVNKGLGTDKSSGNAMPLGSIATALRSLVDRLGRPIDLVAFDACNMQLIEVAYEIADSALVVVGSQEEEPGGGWPYEPVLRSLSTEPGRSTESWAMQIVEAYSNAHPQLSITQSAVSTSELGKLRKALDKLSVLLEASLPDRYAAIRNAYNRVRKYVYPDYVDLAHLLELIGNQLGASVEQEVADALAALEATVIANGAIGPSVTNSNGISIYFPTSHLYDPAYENLKFAKDAHWPRFLATYFDRQAPERIARLEELTAATPEELGLRADRYAHELEQLFAALSQDVAPTSFTSKVVELTKRLRAIMENPWRRQRLNGVGLEGAFNAMVATTRGRWEPQ